MVDEKNHASPRLEKVKRRVIEKAGLVAVGRGES